jgi:hypothetical protein
VDDLRQLRALLDRLARRVLALEQLTPRRATVSLTNIAVGLTTVEVSWATPINGSYTPVVTVVAGAVNLPSLVVAAQSGSKSSTGFTVLVVNTAALPIAAAGLDIVAIPGI